MSTGPTASQAQELEIQHLRDTVAALRRALEEQQAECQLRVDKARADADALNHELKDTIQALRLALEAQALNQRTAQQRLESDHRQSLEELRESVRAQRRQLEERHG